MKTGFLRRLRQLESQNVAGTVLLKIAGGGTVTLSGRGDFVLGLLRAIGSGSVTPEQTRQISLVRQSVEVEEPGDGHMSDLVRIWPLDPDPMRPDLVGKFNVLTNQTALEERR